jgi:hypothetical protein
MMVMMVVLMTMLVIMMMMMNGDDDDDDRNSQKSGNKKDKVDTVNSQFFNNNKNSRDESETYSESGDEITQPDMNNTVTKKTLVCEQKVSRDLELIKIKVPNNKCFHESDSGEEILQPANKKRLLDTKLNVARNINDKLPKLDLVSNSRFLFAGCRISSPESLSWKHLLLGTFILISSKSLLTFCSHTKVFLVTVLFISGCVISSPDSE